jgi:NADPH-dependent glutamate synthase beta subunit-like oxidoreductase
MPQMPERIATHDNWLGSVRTFQIDYGQEEAITLFGSDPRRYNTLTRRFIGDEKGNLVGLETVEVEWTRENGKNALREVAGTEKLWEADVVFLAMGFVGAEKAKFLEDLGVEYTDHKTIAVNKAKQTSVPNVFAAGDCERGQSLVVWAIADGRDAAKGVNDYLKGN